MDTGGRIAVGPHCPVFFFHTLREGLQTYTYRDPRFREDGRGAYMMTLTSHLMTNDGVPYHFIETKNLT